MGMQYLTIKNRGECPVEGITVFGVSSARGDSSKIGQFGSGAKHGVLTCLRGGLNPVIYTGRTKVTFFTEPTPTYNKILVKIGSASPKELFVALEFGALDWDDVSMALREFISNAIDAVEGDISKISFKVVERIHPEEGSTIVGVPYTPEVQKYFANLKEKFLHFGRGEQAIAIERGPVSKVKSGSTPKVYRKGVFVRELRGEDSLFDYNFGDEVKIDEARNMNDYSATNNIAEIVASSEVALTELFEAIQMNKQCWELAKLPGWYFTTHAGYNKEVWQETWTKVFGATAVVCPACVYGKFAESARNNGYNPILVPDGGIYDALKSGGVVTIYNVLENVNDEGHEIFPVIPECQKVVDAVWEWIEFLNLAACKTKPPVKMFTAPMNGGSITRGYYDKGIIYIHTDNPTDKKIILEELAHHITESADCCRTFQDFAFRGWAAMMDV